MKLLLWFLALLSWAWAAPTDLRFEVVDNLPGSGTCTLIVRNLGKQGERFVLPAYAVLSHPSQQDVMTLESKSLAVPPGGQVQCRVGYLCVGRRSEKAEGKEYQWVAEGDHSASVRARSLWETCKSLQSNGDLPPTPMLPAVQLRVISQYAYWCEQGDLKKEDVRQLLIASLSPEPEKEPEVEKAVDNIWESVDLTLKTEKAGRS